MVKPSAEFSMPAIAFRVRVLVSSKVREAGASVAERRVAKGSSGVLVRPSVIQTASDGACSRMKAAIVSRCASRAGIRADGVRARIFSRTSPGARRAIGAGAEASATMPMVRPVRWASLMMVSAADWRAVQSGAEAQPESRRSRTGPSRSNVARSGAQTGPDIARMIRAMMMRRSQRSHGGIRFGSLASGTRSRIRGSGGKRSVCGRGGEARSRK